MKLATAYLAPRIPSTDNLFISEMRAARAFRRAKIPAVEESRHFHHAASLLRQMLSQGVVRPHARLPAYPRLTEENQKFVTVSCFAYMVWLLIARDMPAHSMTPNKEHALLYTCCDLALVVNDQIRDAGHATDELARLLSTYARMV